MRIIKIYNPTHFLYPAISECIKRKDLILTREGDHPKISGEVIIKDKNLEVRGISAIVQYLDEKFPHPPLLPIEPEKRAIIRMATADLKIGFLHEKLSLYKQNIPKKNFFSGEQPSVLDIFIYALAPEDAIWAEFKERF